MPARSRIQARLSVSIPQHRCVSVEYQAYSLFDAVKLSERTLEELARMVVGDAKYFPYRSSYYITHFFSRCGLSFGHDGTTRPIWTRERLVELNLGNGQSA